MKINAIAIVLGCAVLATACSSPKTIDYTQFVNVKTGSGGHGHVFVGASVPFGMVQLGPTSIPQVWDWCSGYHDSDSTVIGFSHTHLEGTGIGDLFDVTLMPVVGDVTFARGDYEGQETGLWSYADRSKEVAVPGYYSVPLTRYDITAELTATKRVGFHRYTFPASTQAGVVIDLENGGCWDKAYDTGIEVVDSVTVKGWRHSNGWAKDQRLYYYAQFSKPFTSFQKEGMYGRADFETEEGEQILVKVALSAVDTDGAAAAMAAELPGWDFDGTVSEAHDAWNEELSKIAVEGSDKEALTVFYTAMYHTMIQPCEFSDVNGDYRGANNEVYRGADFTNYTIFSLWDTYRAANPLMTIIHPDKMDDIANTFIKIFQEQGKLPVWHLWGNETDCMVGRPGVIVLADILVKGFDGFDKNAAYQALKNSSLNPERGENFRDQYGYIPADKIEESVAKDMEYAIADAAMAEAAKYLGQEEDYEFFLSRSKSYRHYFDPETLFIRGKKSDGSWVLPFNPYYSEHEVSPYCEGNAWQYTWLVPQDYDGLVALYGSEEKLVERLDSLFSARAEIEGENASPDISGLIGQYAHGNEPSHHIIYFYTMAGQPWKAADKIREVASTLYFNDPNGLSGNEDVGQMSAWYVLSALGFYEAEPASTKFWFGTPLFDKASIKVAGGTFTVTAKGNSAENRYIQTVTLNGQPYTLPYLEYSDIVSGGELVLIMGSEPAVWY